MSICLINFSFSILKIWKFKNIKQQEISTEKIVTTEVTPEQALFEEADETEDPESPEIQEEESESDTDENIEELMPEDAPAEQNDEQETDTADEPAVTDEPVEETQEDETEATDQVNIIYTAHLSNVGWTEEFKNGESSAYGRMEALTIHTDTDPEKLNIKYQVHVQTSPIVSKLSFYSWFFPIRIQIRSTRNIWLHL